MHLAFDDAHIHLLLLLHFAYISICQPQIAVVQPIKVLYLVVDGSLPRAKMNQQLLPIRSAKEAEVTAPEIIARSKGGVLPDELKDKKRFDSNCITPGTDFTEIEFCSAKVVEFAETDPFSKGAVRDCVNHVLGEGEHKVDFIREQEKQSRMVENWIVRTGKTQPYARAIRMPILSCWVSLRTNPNSCCCRCRPPVVVAAVQRST
jgi:hypothetical protein